MSSSSNAPEVFTRALRQALPDFIAVRDRLKHCEQSLRVDLTADSTRMPELLRLTVAIEMVRANFSYDSNRTLNINRFLAEEPYSAQLALHFLVKDGSIAEVCSYFPKIVRSYVGASASVDAEVAAADIADLLGDSVYRLTNDGRLSTQPLDNGRETMLVAAFMGDHSHLFRGVSAERVMIARVDEVAEWLTRQPDYSMASSSELQLAAYQIYMEVRNICLESQSSEWNLRYR